jgi:carboxyl-terminal processing protease
VTRPGPARRLRALAALVLLGAACRDAPAEPPAAAASRPAPDEPGGPVPEQPACRDWSTLDLATLEPLARGRHAPLLDQVWRRVIETHYDPTLGCRPWGALRDAYAQRVADAATDDEAYAQINAMLHELGHSHLELFPPSRGEGAAGPASPAVTVRWIEDAPVVVEAAPPVVVGSVLRAIDGRPLGPLVAETRARTEPHAVPLAVARAVAARLSCARPGLTRTLDLVEPGTAEATVRTVPCQLPEGERVTLGNLRNLVTRVEHRMLGDDVGLLAFNVWMLPMVERVEAAMVELRRQGMRALVLDLRGNPGGVGAMAVPVARLLLSERASLGTLRFRDFEQELVVLPSTPGFSGPVAVLVDEGTASTSEIFVVGLRDLERITVVGARASAGAALPSVIEAMRDGSLLQSVVADHRSPRGTVVEGKGVVPDVVVPETREAIAAGRDPVLDAAREHLEALVRNVPPSGVPTDAPRGATAG